MAELVRKLSPDSILGSDRKRPESPTWFYRIAGRVTGSETGTTQFGEYTELTGEFTAVRFDNGEVFNSGRCFLPCGMAEMLANALKSSESPFVDFIYDIGLKPGSGKRDGDSTKYEYMVRNPNDNDTENRLLRAIASIPLPPNTKALPTK